MSESDLVALGFAVLALAVVVVAVGWGLRGLWEESEVVIPCDVALAPGRRCGCRLLPLRRVDDQVSVVRCSRGHAYLQTEQFWSPLVTRWPAEDLATAPFDADEVASRARAKAAAGWPVGGAA